MKDNTKNSRRKFLDKGLKLAVASAIGGLGLSKITSKLNATNDDSSGEKMELMTTDGTLIQVDSSEVMELQHNAEHDAKYNIREGMPYSSRFIRSYGITAQCRTRCKI